MWRGSRNWGTIGLCVGSGASADLLRVESKWDSVRNLRHLFILVQAGALVQCSVDREITVDCVTTYVLVCRMKVASAILSLREDFTVGTPRILVKGSLACCLWVAWSS